jgi:uncharacterized protein (DUF885 family)
MTSPVFALSDTYIEKDAALDPGTATYLGIPGYDHLMTDFSPAGHAAREELSRSTLAQLDSLATDSDHDRLAAGVLREGLQADIMAFDAGDHLSSIRIIAGDVDAARSIFDLMPTDTAADWEVIAKRMANVPGAFAPAHRVSRVSSPPLPNQRRLLQARRWTHCAQQLLMPVVPWPRPLSS